MSEPRKSCKDAIPTCNNICQRELNCHDEHGQPHLCERKCHTGNCGPCDKSTVTTCDCGREKKQLLCSELIQNPTFKCKYTCNKKKKCGRHRCNKKCCNVSNSYFRVLKAYLVYASLILSYLLYRIMQYIS